MMVGCDLEKNCTYRPTLVRPLLMTMTTLAAPRRAVALVVVEFRAEDVLREFLQGWIALEWYGASLRTFGDLVGVWSLGVRAK